MKFALGIAALTALISTQAAAVTFESYISELPDKGHVVLEGTVEKVDGEDQFTLRDESGLIDVRVDNNQSLMLNKGTAVTVYGYVDSGIFKKDIEATNVVIDQPVQQIGTNYYTN